MRGERHLWNAISECVEGTGWEDLFQIYLSVPSERRRVAQTWEVVQAGRWKFCHQNPFLANQTHPTVR